MGKAKREREKRRAEAQKRVRKAARLAPPEAISALLELETLNDFDELVRKHPEIQAEEMREWVEGLAGFDGYSAWFGPMAELLRAKGADLEPAFADFRRASKKAEATAQKLAPVAQEIEALAEDGQVDEVIALVDELLPEALAAGVGTEVGFLRMSKGKALFSTASGDRADNLESARDEFQASLPLVVSGWQAADCLMHAGLVYLERVHGDRAENIEQAAILMTNALEEPGLSQNRQLESTIENNLAAAFLRRQHGDRVENLRRAEDLCRAALTYRSPERAVVDWVHTQLTLADVVFDLSRAEGGSLDSAVGAYRAVVAESNRIGRTWLLAAAHRGLGRCLRIIALPSKEKEVEAFVQGRTATADMQLLREARDHLSSAYELIEPAPDPLFEGRVCSEFALVLKALEEKDEAIRVGRQALSVLRPMAAPSECVEVGSQLGALLAEREEWTESAAAFGDAVDAAELVFHARLETRHRRADATGFGRLFRWAALAMAMAGDPQRAALTLEKGRTRELRRRLGLERLEPDALDGLPEDLVEAYRHALADLAQTSFLSDEAPGRAFQEVLEAIRQVSGFEDFGASAQLGELRAATEDGWPLIYINPTPYGTLVLLLSQGTSDVEIQASLLEPTALAVFLRLMAGDAVDFPAGVEGEVRSYFAVVLGLEDPYRDPRPEFDEALPWLGEHVMKPIADTLSAADASGVTLVPCGPISSAPLAAAPWGSSQGDLCLLDLFRVRHAPSAVAMAASLSRAHERHDAEPFLIALADPTRDLDAAVPEAEEVASKFTDGRHKIAKWGQATSSFLQNHVGRATHLHLACHGSANLIEATDAALLLADGPLSLDDLARVAPIAARIAVVSACQSGVTNIGDPSEEGVSIASALVGSGAACAVASLWPVDDLATALLMSRLYHELVEQREAPDESLRIAQLWLRDLDLAGRESFLDKHPTIRAEFARRRPGGSVGPADAALAGASAPYAHPYYWAGFIAVGA